jgi:hypothetical protein
MFVRFGDVRRALLVKWLLMQRIVVCVNGSAGQERLSNKTVSDQDLRNVLLDMSVHRCPVLSNARRQRDATASAALLLRLRCMPWLGPILAYERYSSGSSASPNDLICAHENRVRNLDVQLFGRLEIHDELELPRLLDW